MFICKRSSWLQELMEGLSETVGQGIFREIDALVVTEEDGGKLLEIACVAESDFHMLMQMRDYKRKQPIISVDEFCVQFQEAPILSITRLYKYVCPPSALDFIHNNAITPQELYYFHLDKPRLHPLTAISKLSAGK